MNSLQTKVVVVGIALILILGLLAFYLAGIL